MLKKRFIISGRVQGVFYRASMLHEARRLGLNGWVRNRFDGTVEACVQGDGQEIELMRLWCSRGPDMARVDNVEITDAEQEPDCADFKILG